MIWENALNSAASVMGTDTTAAGLILSMIFTMLLALSIEIAAKGRANGMGGLIMGLLGIIFFTAIEWIPIWVGALIGFFVAIILFWYLSSIAKGG